MARLLYQVFINNVSNERNLNLSSKAFHNEKDILILRKSLGRSFIKNKSIKIFPLSYLKFAFNINLVKFN